MFKTLFFRYQVAMYYVQQTATEYNKIAGFVNNILLAATFLATVFAIHLNAKQLALLWFLIMVACYLIGRLLVMAGIVAYNAQLGNKQNPEIMELLKRVKRIEKLLSSSPPK